MRIDDEELRDIFKTSCEERIQAIDQGLLHLEAQPDDLATVEGMLRDAHSLKGDSNMLGQEDLGRVAHQMETVLSEVKRGDRPFTPELGDRLARGMTAVRAMVEEAVTGQPANVQLFYVLADLMGGAAHDPQLPNGHGTPPPTRPPDPDPPTVRATPPCLPSPDPAASVESDPAASVESDPAAPLEPGRNNHNGAIAHPPELGPSPSEKNIPESAIKANSTDNPLNSGYRIETVRVPTHHLDSLMTQAGELTVTKIRIAHRLTEAEAIATLWEEWNRDIFVNRTLLNNQYDTGKQQHLERFFGLMENAMEALGKLSGQL
ncbi:MAG: Hpt domain-containing protein, partial [Leptolyngbyaceae bacterium]|nr:Hpt domain-containing protein [Leptolyngbyaceae bacterium]